MNISVRYQYNNADAKDAVNSSYLKVLNSLDQYDQTKDFESWVSRICINTNIDLIRKTKIISRRELLYEPQQESIIPTNSISNEAIDALNREDLLDLIHKLPSIMREVFVLYAVDGYSHKEIGSLLNISPEGSRYYLFEARKKLKNIIEKEFHGSKMNSL